MHCSKFCINARSFSAWMGSLLFAEFFGTCYLKSVITTIEKRFSLPSTTTALLTSSFQIGSMSVMVLVSYFGSRYHRPRTIGIGCLLMSLGFFLCAVPQFLGNRYNFVDISSNPSSSSISHSSLVCTTSSTTNKSVECDEELAEASNLYLFILIGIIICGIGSTPIQPLGFSYIDDHVAQHNAALYVGIVTTISLLSPAVAFVVGSFTLKIWVDAGWVDTSDISITPQHTSWVGAWWIGLIATGAIMLLISLPFWLFPKSMIKEQQQKQANDIKPTKSKDGDFATERIRSSFKVESGGLLAAFKRLFTNVRYLLIVTLWTCECFRVSGLSLFIMKYIEVAFGKSASASSFLVGAINLPALVLGTITGSFIIKHWRFGITGITRLSLISIGGSIVTFGPIIFVGCDTVATAGLNVAYPGTPSSTDVYSVTNACNTNCNCEESVYTPVCGPNDITYISPCHAGCTEFTTDELGDIKNYASCVCAGGELIGNQTVTVGRCVNSYCEDHVWSVIILKSLANWFGGLHVTPLMLMVLRSLKPEDKAFGIGIMYLTFRLLAFIPGPIIFGYVIDQTCLHWIKKPCSTRLYCSVYDNASYRRGFIGLIVIAQVSAMCISLVYYFKYAKPDGKKQEQEKKSNGKSTNGEASKLYSTDENDDSATSNLEKETLV